MSLEEMIRAANPAADVDPPVAAARAIAGRVLSAARDDAAARRRGTSAVLRVAVVAGCCAVAAGITLVVVHSGSGHSGPPAGAPSLSRPTTTVSRPAPPAHGRPPARPAVNTHTGPSGQPLAPPTGWVPVTLGEARLFVPASWTVTPSECAPWQPRGTVYVRRAKAFTAFCPFLAATQLTAADNVVLLMPIGVLDAPGPRVGILLVAGFTATEYRWPRTWDPTEQRLEWPPGVLELRFASLGVDLVVSGPLRDQVLVLLRRS